MPLAGVHYKKKKKLLGSISSGADNDKKCNAIGYPTIPVLYVGKISCGLKVFQEAGRSFEVVTKNSRVVCMNLIVRPVNLKLDGDSCFSNNVGGGMVCSET